MKRHDTTLRFTFEKEYHKWLRFQIQLCVYKNFDIPFHAQTYICRGISVNLLDGITVGETYYVCRARPFQYSVHNLKGDIEYYDLSTNSTVYDLYCAISRNITVNVTVPSDITIKFLLDGQMCTQYSAMLFAKKIQYVVSVSVIPHL